MDVEELTRRLSTTTLFAPLERTDLKALLARSPRRAARVGDWLADEPEGLRHHLVLLSGEVEVQRRWIGADGAEGGRARRVAVDADGAGFALVSVGGGPLHVQAASAVEYLAIDSEAVEDLLGWFHLGAFALPEPHLKVFHRLPLENVSRAIDCLAERPVAAGETIVSQGEPGDAYYVILEGEAEVWQAVDGGGAPRLVNRLVDGDSFGEEALLAECSRTATVTMVTPGSLLVLSKAHFDALLRPPMVEELDAAAASAWLARGTARLLDCRERAEHEAGCIPGSQLLPLRSLRHDGVHALDREAAYIVYCDSGRRSRAAAFLLRERGLQAWALAGGLARWPYAVQDTCG